MSSPAGTAEPRMKKTKPDGPVAPIDDEGVAEVLMETNAGATLPAKSKPHVNTPPSQELADDWRAKLAKQALPSAIASAPHAWQALTASRLKQFSSAHVELGNRLLAARMRGTWSEDERDGEQKPASFQWAVIEHKPISAPVFVSLGVSGDASPRWQIGLNEHSGLLPWMPQPFATLSESAKHLCVTIALAPLLAALKETFDLPAEVTGVVQAKPSPELLRVSVRVLRATDAPGDTIGDVVELALPHDALETAIAKHKVRSLRAADVLPPMLQIQLPVCVAVANLPMQSILSLKAGDVVLFEGEVARVNELPLFLCAGSTGLALINRNDVLSVDALFPLSQFHHEPEGFVMNQARATEKNESVDSAFTPSADQASSLVDVKSVPVTLQFEIGRLSLTVQEVSDLAKGTVIKLPAKLSPETVTIRANGRSFATGEIVHIDDQLGVKITSIANAPTG